MAACRQASSTGPGRVDQNCSAVSVGVDLPELPGALPELLFELPGLLPELPGLLPESLDLLLHEPPGVALWIARVRRDIGAGQVAGTWEGFWLVAGTPAFLSSATPLFFSTAGRATL
jgi:hypothetical protein